MLQSRESECKLWNDVLVAKRERRYNGIRRSEFESENESPSPTKQESEEASKAPIDIVAAMGKGMQHCYIIQSLELVVIRLGDNVNLTLHQFH